jgi:hypothetical protein
MPKTATEPQEAIQPATTAPQSIQGWAPKGRWRRATCNGLGSWDELAPVDGAEPLWAEVNASLTFDEIDEIPGGGSTYAELMKHVAPNVRAWNVTARNRETGEWEPVPPPLEGGEASLRKAPRLVVDWLAACIKFGHIGNEDRAGKSPQPGDMDDGSDGMS